MDVIILLESVKSKELISWNHLYKLFKGLLYVVQHIYIILKSGESLAFSDIVATQ